MHSHPPQQAPADLEMVQSLPDTYIGFATMSGDIISEPIEDSAMPATSGRS